VEVLIEMLLDTEMDDETDVLTVMLLE